ncbi:MAG: flavin reductase family protein [Alphaproteobacteria bacterium]
MSKSFHSYSPAIEGHGLPHDPVKACVVPRPIGWISSLGSDGVPNLAPYSFFNLIGDTPHMCAFASSGQKDTVTNVEANGEFVYNMVSEDLLDAMNLSSTTLPASVDEFEAAGLELLPSIRVKAPRVARSPIHLECKVFQIVDLPSKSEQRNTLVLAEIVAVHISQSVLVDGLIDLSLIKPLARLGYMEYAEFGNIFNLRRPQSLSDTPKRT